MSFPSQVLQLYQITQINHGLMMVGPSGSGKTMAWRVLLKALERLEGLEGVAHIIDPKAISKDHLYGTLDPNTREWTDGLFTHILRKYEQSYARYTHPQEVRTVIRTLCMSSVSHRMGFIFWETLTSNTHDTSYIIHPSLNPHYAP